MSITIGETTKLEGKMVALIVSAFLSVTIWLLASLNAINKSLSDINLRQESYMTERRFIGWTENFREKNPSVYVPKVIGTGE